MDFQTVVNVLNDAIHYIEQNPKQFVDNLVNAIRRGKGDASAGGHCNAAEVLGQDHADAFQLYLVHGNTGERIMMN